MAMGGIPSTTAELETATTRFKLRCWSVPRRGHQTPREAASEKRPRASGISVEAATAG